MTNPYLHLWAARTSQLWQTPSQFWQTVHSIQTQRTQMLAEWASHAPQHVQAIVTAGSPAAAWGAWAKWQGETLSHAARLNAITQAHQVSLMHNWSQAVQQSKHTSTSQSAAPATPSARPAPAPTVSSTISAPTPASIMTQALPLGEEISAPTSHPAQVSRTANGVVRTSAGSTIAAAAAARRSVVAKRQKTARARVVRPAK